jgi:hypothetical protein
MKNKKSVKKSNREPFSEFIEKVAALADEYEAEPKVGKSSYQRAVTHTDTEFDLTFVMVKLSPKQGWAIAEHCATSSRNPDNFTYQQYRIVTIGIPAERAYEALLLLRARANGTISGVGLNRLEKCYLL